MPTLFYLFLLLSCCTSLVILSPEQLVLSHTRARFGWYYGNASIFGNVEESEPLNACTPLESNHTGSVVLAIRGGVKGCTFETKVTNVFFSFFRYLYRLSNRELLLRSS